MLEDVAKLPACPLVIHVPLLYNAGVGAPKLPVDGEDPDAICKHGEGVPLGHSLLAMKEVA